MNRAIPLLSVWARKRDGQRIRVIRVEGPRSILVERLDAPVTRPARLRFWISYGGLVTKYLEE